MLRGYVLGETHTFVTKSHRGGGGLCTLLIRLAVGYVATSASFELQFMSRRFSRSRRTFLGSVLNTYESAELFASRSAHKLLEFRKM